MVSSIYNTPYILKESGSMKGKSRKQLEREDAKIIAFNKRKLKHFKSIYQMIESDKYNDWEMGFLTSIVKQNNLSKKQLEILNKLKHKL